MTYEYKTILINVGDVDTKLIEFGYEGWKIISVVSVGHERIHYVLEKVSDRVVVSSDVVLAEKNFKCRTCGTVSYNLIDGWCGDCIPF